MTILEDGNRSVSEKKTANDDISSSPGERRGYKRRLEGALANEERKVASNNGSHICESEVSMVKEGSTVVTSLAEEKVAEASSGAATNGSGIAAGTFEFTEDPETISAMEIARNLPDGMMLEWNVEKTRAVLTVAKENNAASGNRELRVCLVGRARICVVEGSAEVLGHALEANENAYDDSDPLQEPAGGVVVTSPYWSSWMTIEAKPQSLPCKIILDCIRGPESFWVSAPKRPIVLPQSWKTCAQSIVHDFCASSSSDSSNSRRIVNALEDYEDSRSKICMITGAKGVGKSTLLRYLTNRVLSATSEINEVAILDTDVGQPELAPPGLLRLSIVQKPLLQPPYWNLIGGKKIASGGGDEQCSVDGNDGHGVDQQSEGPSYGPQLDHTRVLKHELESDEEDDEVEGIEVISSVFFGASTSKSDPTRYMDAIHLLMQKYNTEVTHNGRYPIPLLINMDGWVKGVGYEILSALIESLEPTHLVQIIGETPGQTFDLPPSVYERSMEDAREAPLDDPIVSAKSEVESSSSLPNVYKLEACQTMTGASLCRIPAFTTRNFRWATYFLPNELQTIDAWDFASAKDLQTGWIAATNPDRTTTVPHWWHTTETIGHEDDPAKVFDVNSESSELNDDCRLAQALAREKPYCVPMEAIDAFVIGSDFEDHLRLADGETNSDIIDETYYRIFQALNGRVVALCTNTSTMECLGYGILRSIDWERRLLYILVPPSLVSAKNPKDSSLVLSRVKALVGGNLPLPLAILYRGVYAESFPYLTTLPKQAILGSEPMKSRNNIGRRGLANAERNTN